VERDSAPAILVEAELVPEELHPITFLVFRSGQELLPEAVWPLHQLLSIPKIDGLPTALSAIPYRTGRDFFANFLLKLLRNRKTLYCNKETHLLKQNDLPF
jgi:hypothetical protein